MTSRIKHVLAALCASPLLFCMIGCVPMGPSKPEVKKAPTRTSIHAAMDSGDWEYVRFACEYEDKFSQYAYKVQPLACDEQSKHESLAPLKAANCENIKEIYSGVDKKRRGLEYVKAAARVLLDCKHYSFVFENVPEEGEKMGTGHHALLWVARKTPAMVSKAWVAYLESHKGSAFFDLPEGHNSYYAMSATARWLVHDKLYDLCAPLTAALAGEPERKLVPFMDYIKDASCTDAKADIATLLESESPDVRERACKTLEVIGDKAVLPAIKRASMDLHKEVRDGEMKPVVMIACLKAERVISER